MEQARIHLARGSHQGRSHVSRARFSGDAEGRTDAWMHGSPAMLEQASAREIVT